MHEPVPHWCNPVSYTHLLGVRQFLALNRKFDVAYTDRTDLIPLTYEALDLLNGTYLK